MWELDYKESWTPKNGCFCTVVLEKTLESSLDCKNIKPVHPKGNQSWIFIGRTDPEAEAPILWPPDEKNWLTGKDPDAGKDWKQEEKGMTEDKIIGGRHRPNEHEFKQAPEVCNGQESLACCSPWGHKQTWLSSWTELNLFLFTSSLSFPLVDGGSAPETSSEAKGTREKITQILGFEVVEMQEETVV